MAARVIERRQQVVLPPAVPVNPLARPPNPLARAANPLARAANPLARAATNPLRVSSGVNPLARAGVNPLGRCSDDPTRKRRRRSVHRRRIVVPPGGPRRRLGSFFLPTQEIDGCDCGGCSPTYWHRGDHPDFTAIAESLAQREECDGMCGMDERNPEGDHVHFMKAVRLDIGEQAMCLFDVDQMWAFSDAGWDEVYRLFAAARQRVIGAIDVLLADAVIGASVARNTLATAGVYEVGTSLRDPVGQLREHLGDLGVLAAFADEGVQHATGSALNWFPELYEALEEASAAEIAVFVPADLQAFVIDPDLVPGADQQLRMVGPWTAEKVRYHSVFDPEVKPGKYPWCIGWREITLVPGHED